MGNGDTSLERTGNLARVSEYAFSKIGHIVEQVVDRHSGMYRVCSGVAEHVCQTNSFDVFTSASEENRNFLAFIEPVFPEFVIVGGVLMNILELLEYVLIDFQFRLAGSVVENKFIVFAFIFAALVVFFPL